MPAVGADAGDADEGGASPSGGSLRLLLLLLELEVITLVCGEKVKWTKKFGGSCTTYVQYVVPFATFDPGIF